MKGCSSGSKTSSCDTEDQARDGQKRNGEEKTLPMPVHVLAREGALGSRTGDSWWNMNGEAS